MKEHGVLVDVLDEVLVRRFAVLIELDLSVFVIKVQQSVQRMVVELLIGVDGFGDGSADVSGHGKPSCLLVLLHECAITQSVKLGVYMKLGCETFY